MPLSSTPEIENVILFIQHHLDEPLTLTQLARYAGYSPYYFTRIFKEVMGISPFYYISALRMQKAKMLLLQTDFSIRDIALEIGQQSLGTFTTQFTKRIGVTPSKFRKSTHQASAHFRSLKQLDRWTPDLTPARLTNRVTGTVESEIPFEGFILIGLFPKPVPEGLPLYGTLLSSVRSFCFHDVKPGVYYMMATSVSWEMGVSDFLLPEKSLRFRSHEPIIVNDFVSVPPQHITLRPPTLDDPPILISIPLLMNIFLNRFSAIDKKFL
jgi:AraC-like DNA-binding protein